MGPGDVSICGEILIQKGKNLEASRCMSPITHQVHHDCEHTLQYNARTFHPAIGVVREASGESTACFGVGEDRIAFCAKGESKEFSA